MAEVAHVKDSATLVTGSLAAVNDALTLNRFQTWGAIGFQIAGTFVGTVTFECTVDGTNWAALSVVPSNSATPASTATAPGVFVVSNNAFQGVRARCSAFTSGSILVAILSRPSQA